ncbi:MULTISPECIES: hypothetical protein [Winogradskyella]|uniref:hypothetical protein n=1 Tax=Winogradskyella TaxID=286104 RepID=UPI0015CC8AF8|nr:MULTISPECIES: hypothetical protein [Winogradskyella]QXP79990.1 hypothetical protein H0I32_04980 [Winogradskyella sp. HaHa_3_26]
MSASTMNTVMKNNRKLLPKRDRFKNRLGGYDRNVKTEYNFPKATTKQLKEIGKRLREERKTELIKVVIVSMLLFLVMVCFLYYYSDAIRSSLWF